MMGSQTIGHQSNGSYAARGPPTWPMSLFTSQDLTEEPRDVVSHSAFMRVEVGLEELRTKLNIESASRVTAIEGLHSVTGGMRGDIELLQKEVMAMAEAQEKNTKNLEKQMVHLQAVIQETVSKQVSGEERLMSLMKQRLDSIESKLGEDLRKESNVREADIYELRELVGGEQLARQGHQNSIQEILDEERKAREAHMNHLNTHADRLDGHADNHNALIDRVAELEELVKKEKDVREADIYELREIVGGEQLARQGHHANIQEILEEERKAREAHMNDHTNRHDDHANNHMALVERMDALERLLQAKAEQLLEMIGHETKSRELNLGKLDEHAKVTKEMQEVLDKLENKLHTEIAKEQGVREADIYELRELVGGEQLARQGHHANIQEILDQERRAREAHADRHDTHADNHSALVDRVGMLESLVQKEKDVREADIYELREMVGGEQLARQGHHTSVQEILEEERKAREQHMFHLNDFADRHDAHANNHNAVIERLTDLETTVQNQILGSQDQVLLTRVNDLERHLMNEAATRDNEVNELRNVIGGEQAAMQQQQAAVQGLEQQVVDAKASASHVAAHLNNEIKHLRELLDTHSHDFDTPDEPEETPAETPTVAGTQSYIITRTVTLPPQQVSPPTQYVLPPQPATVMPAVQKSMPVVAPAPVTYQMNAPMPAQPTTPTNMSLGSIQIPPMSMTNVVPQQPVAYPENTSPKVNTRKSNGHSHGHHKVTTSTAKYNGASPTRAGSLVS